MAGFRRTEYVDTQSDAHFRAVVHRLRNMGFGRMAQIVSEEWRAYDPDRNGLLCVCPECQTLFVWDTGRVVVRAIKNQVG